MIKHGTRPHLRLVSPQSSSAEPKAAPHDVDPQMKNLIQSVYLPFSKETLWLRMEPCICGGANLFYVKRVHLKDLPDHKPCLGIDGDIAEEIVLAEHVQYRRLHRFFGISPLKLVLKRVFLLRRKILSRDIGLEQSVGIKHYFEDAFGI